MLQSSRCALTEIYHGFSMENLCSLYGGHGIPWEFHGNTMETMVFDGSDRWFPHEFPMERRAGHDIPWDSHGFPW